VIFQSPESRISSVSGTGKSKPMLHRSEPEVLPEFEMVFVVEEVFTINMGCFFLKNY
jgi:hypothetical protein